MAVLFFCSYDLHSSFSSLSLTNSFLYNISFCFFINCWGHFHNAMVSSVSPLWIYEGGSKIGIFSQGQQQSMWEKIFLLPEGAHSTYKHRTMEHLLLKISICVSSECTDIFFISKILLPGKRLFAAMFVALDQLLRNEWLN